MGSNDNLDADRYEHRMNCKQGILHAWLVGGGIAIECIEYESSDTEAVLTASRSVDAACATPDEARAFARHLLRLADNQDALEKPREE